MTRERFLAPLSVLLLCHGCATSEVQKPEEDSAAEVRAQMAIKASLLDDEQVAAAPIRVEYQSGRVRLSGFVETEDEKQRAGEVARRAAPDLEIVNDLRVWRPSGA